MTNSKRELPTDGPTVLWWSHSGRDYSRDRIVRNAFTELGWNIHDFRPAFSPAGHLEAILRRIGTPSLVWVPCFRQRDVAAAQKWARLHHVPLAFDPLISAWDKQVFERRKFEQDSRQATRLLKHESKLFQQSDVVIADTEQHAQFFSSAHGMPLDQLAVIPVSAEEGQFVEQPAIASTRKRRKILFYGSFIGLQGPQHIAKAAIEVPNADWTFIGTGPLLEQCQQIASGQNHITFLPRVPYETLPSIIGDADILMGIFGDSEKAGRVIPNKVYQALACGRPVVTRQSDAYPVAVRDASSKDSGITWTAADSESEIAAAVSQLLATSSNELQVQGLSARKTYLAWFSNEIVKSKLQAVIDRLSINLSQLPTAA